MDLLDTVSLFVWLSVDSTCLIWLSLKLVLHESDHKNLSFLKKNGTCTHSDLHSGIARIDRPWLKCHSHKLVNLQTGRQENCGVKPKHGLLCLKMWCLCIEIFHLKNSKDVTHPWFLHKTNTANVYSADWGEQYLFSLLERPLQIYKAICLSTDRGPVHKDFALKEIKKENEGK